MSELELVEALSNIITSGAWGVLGVWLFLDERKEHAKTRQAHLDDLRKAQRRNDTSDDDK